MVATLSAAMEKQGPPIVVMPEMSEERRNNKKSVLLTSWASVTTALLLLLLVGGAFYVAELKGRECTTTTQEAKTEHTTKDVSRTIDKDGEKTTEDFHVDEDDQTELIIKKSADGNIEMITAVDYKRKISASYIPADDQCLLLAGADMEYLDDWGDEKNKTVTIKDDYQEEDYKVTGNKVTDLSILPADIKPYCQGKPTYWLQPGGKSELEAEAGRHKRGLCIGYRCYWYWGWGWRIRCYYYWSWC